MNMDVRNTLERAIISARIVASSSSFFLWNGRCFQGLLLRRVASQSYLSAEAGVFIESLAASPELELSVVGQDSCIAVEIEHRVGGLPKKDNFCYVQSAILYTTIWENDAYECLH
jgi:hypothetical protein